MDIKKAYGESTDARKRIAAGVEGDGFSELPPRVKAAKLTDAFMKFLNAKDYANAFECVGRLWVLSKRERKSLSTKVAYNRLLQFRRELREYIQGEPDEIERLMGIMGRSYKLTARDRFDDFCIYMEWNRPQDKKFYIPRRKMLLPIVRELQRLADDELDILGISAPPGIGKSALAILFCEWLGGRNPDDGILIGSHSRSILEGMFGEMCQELDSRGEYLFADIFPENQVARTDAGNLKIDLKTAKRFSTFQFGAAGEKLAGKVRAIQLLYCDDLIESSAEAVSPARLETKWRAYADDFTQRKQGRCKELHIATRWSVHDIIGRLEVMYEDYPRAKFLRFPALDEHERSNFDYGGNIGFTTEFYLKQKEVMDEFEFNAIYQQQPVERGGLLYEKNELNYFYDLPEGEPDGIIAACDTANGGGDFTCMVVGAIYGGKHYIIDAVFSDALPSTTDALCARALYDNKVAKAQFESNGAGGRTADKIESLLEEKVKMKGGRKTSITKKYTTANKETKILLSGAWVKENCYFRDPSTVKRNSVYAAFMRNLLSYTVRKPPKHDDAADAMAQYSLFAENAIGAQVQIVKRMF